MYFQIEDTISPNSMSSGYNLLDLNVHVNPIPNIEVFGQVRVQNQLGGFSVRVQK